VTSTVQIFTDGSKSEQRVGAGVAIFRSGNYIKSIKYRLNKRCTHNQNEKLAIVRALDYTQNLQTEDETATIHTDSRMTPDSLKNNNIHTFLIDEIRKLTEMGKNKLKNSVLLGQGARRNPRKRARRHNRKGGSDKCGHQRMLQESAKKCSDRRTK